jgi:hypothetical protein
MNTTSMTHSCSRTAVVLIAIVLAAGCRSTPHAPANGYAAPVATTSAPAAPLGTSLDDIDVRNRADIALKLGRPVAPGPATPQEVAAMSQAGVEPRFIISYINRSPDMQPISAADVIYLHEKGVDDQVVQAMLTPGNAYSRLDVARAMPPRTIIVTDPYWPYGYPYYPYYPHVGVTYGVGYCYH